MNPKHSKRKPVIRRKARRITLGRIVAGLSLAAFAAMAVFLMIDVIRGNSAADKQAAESVITPPPVATRTGAAPEPYAGGARLWLPVTGVDLGNVPFMTPVSYSFELENVGDAPMFISQPSVKMLEGC